MLVLPRDQWPDDIDTIDVYPDPSLQDAQVLRGLNPKIEGEGSHHFPRKKGFVYLSFHSCQQIWAP